MVRKVTIKQSQAGVTGDRAREANHHRRFYKYVLTNDEQRILMAALMGHLKRWHVDGLPGRDTRWYLGKRDVDFQVRRLLRYDFLIVETNMFTLSHEFTQGPNHGCISND